MTTFSTDTKSVVEHTSNFTATSDMHPRVHGKNQLDYHAVNHVSAFPAQSKLFQQRADRETVIQFRTFQSKLQKQGHRYRDLYADWKAMIHSFNGRFQDFRQ